MPRCLGKWGLQTDVHSPLADSALCIQPAPHPSPASDSATVLIAVVQARGFSTKHSGVILLPARLLPNCFSFDNHLYIPAQPCSGLCPVSRNNAEQNPEFLFSLCGQPQNNCQFLNIFFPEKTPRLYLPLWSAPRRIDRARYWA